MFKTRLISGVVLVVIALVTIITGGALLLSVLLAISLIGMHEFYKVTGVHDTLFSPMAIAGYADAVAYYLVAATGRDEYLLPVVMCSLVIVLAVYVFTWPRYHTNQAACAYFGFLYVAVMLSFIFKTRNLASGAFTVWLIFLCSWGCDTCAYCVGVLIGKHKMSPKLSPKKSIEGALGGVAGAALLGVIYAFATAKWQAGAAAPVGEYALICAVGALISMVGDLAASGIKRDHNIKDYGKLIPGHGGILDRFDSVIFTAPVIYLLAMTLM